jgi:hypothetical protein
MVIVDRSKGLDSEAAVVQVWPASARALVRNVEAFICDHLIPTRSRYEAPFPLVDPRTGAGGKYFLVSRNVNTLPTEKGVRHNPSTRGTNGSSARRSAARPVVRISRHLAFVRNTLRVSRVGSAGIRGKNFRTVGR